ncbi:MAG: hypothetical protein IH945_03500 [Armatimonadetes bacterium]|nr:hypothetical protein [Armatimonadota bacterium]
MVLAILDGRKTQTRRLRGLEIVNENPSDFILASVSMVPDQQWFRFLKSSDELTRRIKCPYGKPGDVLWCREAWRTVDVGDYGAIEYRADRAVIECPAKPTKYDDPHALWCLEYEKHGDKWRPSIHMFRCFSRISRLVKDVRVERLQEISDEDAMSEGVFGDEIFTKDCVFPGDRITPACCFANLWNSINAKKHSWSGNPWVFVMQFERMEEAANG